MPVDKSAQVWIAGMLAVIVVLSMALFFVLISSTPGSSTPASTAKPPQNSTPTVGVDGVATGHAYQATTVRAYLTTAQNNDVVVAGIMASIGNGNGNVASVTGCSDSAGLVWHQRVSFTPGYGSGYDGSPWVWEWYAVSSNPLSSDTITCGISNAPTSNLTLIAFGVSGVVSQSPYDPGPMVPCEGQGGGGAVCEIQTTSSDFVFGLSVAYLVNGAPTFIYPGTGFTQIVEYNGGPVALAEYQVAPTNSAWLVSVTSPSPGIAVIGDALQISPS